MLHHAKSSINVLWYGENVMISDTCIGKKKRKWREGLHIV